MTCPNCDSDDVRVITTVKTENGWADFFQVCRSCGVMFVPPENTDIEVTGVF